MSTSPSQEVVPASREKVVHATSKKVLLTLFEQWCVNPNIFDNYYDHQNSCTCGVINDKET